MFYEICPPGGYYKVVSNPNFAMYPGPTESIVTSGTDLMPGTARYGGDDLDSALLGS